jgi:hypothetical protein
MKIISYDSSLHTISINLYGSAQVHANALRQDLEAEFAFEGVNERSVQAMNAYALDWLDGRGVTLEENI